MGGMLGWDKPDCEPFRDVLAHPAIAPALIDLMGVGYRLDHSPLLISQVRGWGICICVPMCDISILLLCHHTNPALRTPTKIHNL